MLFPHDGSVLGVKIFFSKKILNDSERKINVKQNELFSGYKIAHDLVCTIHFIRNVLIGT